MTKRDVVRLAAVCAASISLLLVALYTCETLADGNQSTPSPASVVASAACESLGSYLVAGFTFLLAVVAAFQSRIRARLWHPNLDVIRISGPPDSHKTRLTSRDPDGPSADCYYFLFRVENSGNYRAEQVEVFAASLSRIKADGSYEPVSSFLPMNLLWSWGAKPYLDALSPEMYGHCNLGHIVDPAKRHHFRGEDPPRRTVDEAIPDSKALLHLDVQFPSNTFCHLLQPGTYRLELRIASAATKPILRTIEINFTGEWYDDETRMLTDGIGIKIL